MAKVYIGIGSNMGDREDHCRRAIVLLKEKAVRVLQSSSVFETEPWGLEDQPFFINMALECETDLQPAALLSLLKGIESSMGRSQAVKWGPRIIDLDILLYSDVVVEEAGLRIPHPLMHQRDFVLRPLSEIAPEEVHPVFNKKIRELLGSLSRTSP